MLKVKHEKVIQFVRPDLINLLWDKNDALKYREFSNVKIDFKCPNCNIKLPSKKIADISRRGISCPSCSDGKSYPEKFIFNLLKQLKVKFEIEKTFDWINNKRYDFFIPSLGTIIEVHGIHHYKETFSNMKNRRSLKEEMENDELKKDVALKNGILHYVTIDASYSQMEYLVNNVLNSKLNEIFNLRNIKWIDCHKNASHSLVKEICDFWNKGYKMKEIERLTKLSDDTIRRYLKKGNDMGICTYDAKFEHLKSIRKSIVQLTINGEFLQEFTSISDACRKYESFRISNISDNCRQRIRTAYGYIWMYKTDYDKYIEQKNDRVAI